MPTVASAPAFANMGQCPRETKVRACARTTACSAALARRRAAFGQQRSAATPGGASPAARRCRRQRPAAGAVRARQRRFERAVDQQRLALRGQRLQARPALRHRLPLSHRPARRFQARALPLLDRGPDEGARRVRRPDAEGERPAQGRAGRLVARRQRHPQLPQERRRGGVREPRRAVRHAQQGHRDLRDAAGRAASSTAPCRSSRA